MRDFKQKITHFIVSGTSPISTKAAFKIVEIREEINRLSKGKFMNDFIYEYVENIDENMELLFCEEQNLDKQTLYLLNGTQIYCALDFEGFAGEILYIIRIYDDYGSLLYEIKETIKEGGKKQPEVFYLGNNLSQKNIKESNQILKLFKFYQNNLSLNKCYPPGVKRQFTMIDGTNMYCELVMEKSKGLNKRIIFLYDTLDELLSSYFAPVSSNSLLYLDDDTIEYEIATHFWFYWNNLNQDMYRI